MNEDLKLMDKNVNDLTVGDALKINAVILAVMVGIPAAIVGASVAKEKFDAWNKSRKSRKLTLVPAE